jgi:hypothetical protein
MTQREISAAAQIYPHLPHDAPAPPPRQQPVSVAAAMFPDLVPKPPAPQPAPRPVRTMQWIRDWSGVDPNWARLVGLVPKDGRR